MPPQIARAVWPNVGVEAWYRVELDKLVDEMALDMQRRLRAAWEEKPPTIGFAKDKALAAGVMFQAVTGRVLLLRRVDDGTWAWPAGGVEPSETLEGAARREASEETGWAAGNHLTFLGNHLTPEVCFSTFRCQVAEEFTPILNGEHDAWQWVDPESAPSLGKLHAGIPRALRFRLMATDAASSTLLQKALEGWGGLWTKKLDSLSLSLATKFADRSFSATQAAMAKTFKDAGLTVRFKPTRASMDAYKAVIAENVGLIKSIPEQYLTGVQSAVWDSVRKGGDLSTLSQKVRKRHGVTINRAALIARDQNNKAKAIIENTRRQEIGIKEAIWLHSTAGKEPRPTHVAMSGKRYKLSEGMYDSDEDENVYPGQLINCRCSSKAIIPGFE